MSKATEQEAFEAWKAEYAASLTDPTKKEAFQKVADLDIFKATLRTQDYHKRLAELDQASKKKEAEYKQMGDWYRQAQAKAAEIAQENEKLRKAKPGHAAADDFFDDPVTRATDEPPVGSVRKEDFEQLSARLGEIDKNAPAYTNLMLKLGVRALKENLEFDPDKLFEAAQTNRCDLERAFELLAEPTRAERREAEIVARLEKAREEGRAQALSSIPPDRIRHSRVQPPAIAKLFPQVDNAPVGGAMGNPARVAAAVEEWARMTEGGTIEA
jgi:hypothetical protein